MSALAAIRCRSKPTRCSSLEVTPSKHIAHAPAGGDHPYFTKLGSIAVQACVAGMFELQDHAAFKDHLRDFLVQTKSFSSQDNADLFADEAAAARQVQYLLLIKTALGTKQKYLIPNRGCSDAHTYQCSENAVIGYQRPCP